MLPFLFYEEFCKVLLALEPVFLTCDDLDFSFMASMPVTEEELAGAYKEEFHRWMESPRPVRPHILLLHDTDSGPMQTLDMCAMEQRLGLRSTVSTYARWPYPPKGPCIYDIDFAALVALQQAGFGVTYHCNAGSQAYYSGKGDVYAIYDEDVDFLRAQGLHIRFYSAHGESRLPVDQRNTSFFYPAHVRNKCLSTHNTYGISAHAHYSDGGLSSPYMGAHGDVRFFLRNNAEYFWQNARMKVLFHAVNYFAKDDSVASRHFATHPWVREYWDLYAAGKTHFYWMDTIRALTRAWRKN